MGDATLPPEKSCLLNTFPHIGFVEARGIALEGYESIKSGRNSKVWKLVSKRGMMILKEYFQPSGTARNRLQTEWGFLVQLNHYGIEGVAKPIACDQNLGLALYSFIEGDEVHHIQTTDIIKAAEFICRINTQAIRRLYPNEFSVAADACFCVGEYISLVKRRLERLGGLSGGDQIIQEAEAFVAQALFPAFRSVERSVLKVYKTSDEASEPILSPSDFGFHNSMRCGDDLYFVDFEYAGWDSPVKLICDFICQPQKPVSTVQATQFEDTLFCYFNWPKRVKDQVACLLPLHRIKWCCIMLNEFIPIGLERRLHAGMERQGLLESQLNKAKTYFMEHCR